MTKYLKIMMYQIGISAIERSVFIKIWGFCESGTIAVESTELFFFNSL